MSSDVFHISEIATVEDVEDGDEEIEDEASMNSLVDETERSLNILEQPQAEQYEFSTITNPGYPLSTARALHQSLGRPLPKEEQEQRAPTELNVTV